MAGIKSLFDSHDSRLMIIEDPVTGEPMKNAHGKEMGIYLTSKETEACKRVIADFQKKYRKKEASYGAIQKFSTDLLVAASTGFKDLQLEDDGDIVEFSPEMARDIYTKSAVIRKQVDKFVGADENFLTSVLAA